MPVQQALACMQLGGALLVAGPRLYMYLIRLQEQPLLAAELGGCVEFRGVGMYGGMLLLRAAE